MFDSHLTYLKQTFQKNCYSENVTNRYFELLLNVNHIFKEKVPVVAKKSLQLFFPYLGPISPQLRLNCKKTIKSVLKCCKLQVIFEIPNERCNNFASNTLFPKLFTLSVVCKFYYGLYNEFCYV